MTKRIISAPRTSATGKKLPWFRAYTEMVDDEKLRLLAFEDRWHFVALLCLKGQGVLDDVDNLLFRKVAVKLGVDVRTLEEIARRLAEVGLVDEKTLQPLAWDARQFKSDSSAERTRAYRERMKRHRDVTVTVQDTDTDTDTDTEKNNNKPAPARAKKSSRKPDDLDFSAWPEPPGEQVWKDYKRLRAEKKAPITQTVVNRLGAEIRKAAAMGYTANDFLSECILRGWQGGKAEWLESKQSNSRSGGAFDPLEYVNRNRIKQGGSDVIDV